MSTSWPAVPLAFAGLLAASGCGEEPEPRPAPVVRAVPAPAGTLTYMRMGGDQHRFALGRHGRRLRELPLGVDDVIDVAWSPDGRSMVVTRSMSPSGGDGDAAPEPQEKLWMLDGRGDSPRRLLTEGQPAEPSFSPDGRSVAFTANVGSEGRAIHVLDLGSMAVRRATGADFDGARSPAWSPGGRTIAFTARRRRDPEEVDIFTIRPEGGGITRVTRSRGLREESPAWSPDGGRLVYTLTAGYDSKADLVIAPTDGAGARKLTTGGHGDHDPAWSRDGGTIAFTRNRENWGEDVFVVPAAGGRPVAVALQDEDRIDTAPAWMP